MKKSELRKIIKEEIQKLTEVYEAFSSSEIADIKSYGKKMTLGYNINKGKDKGITFDFTAESPDDGEKNDYSIVIKKNKNGTYEITDGTIYYDEGGSDNYKNFNNKSKKNEKLFKFLDNSLS